MGVGVDIVSISRLTEYCSRSDSIPGFLLDALGIHVSNDSLELAKWIAVNEAVFKSLCADEQEVFRGLKLETDSSGKICTFQTPLDHSFSRIEVSVSHTNEFVVAFAVSHRKLCLRMNIFKLLNHRRSSSIRQKI
jgi:phosphopantetheinyl transferase (holo-ACP synthase)